MSDHDHQYRRYGDYADMPRQLAWFLIAIKEAGLPAVVILVLFYFIFVGQKSYVESQEKLTIALRELSIDMTKINDDEHHALENHKVIIENERNILQELNNHTRR